MNTCDETVSRLRLFVTTVDLRTTFDQLFTTQERILNDPLKFYTTGHAFCNL